MCISRFGLINREGHLPGLCHYVVVSFTNYFGKILPVFDHLSTHPWLTFAKELIYFIQENLHKVDNSSFQGTKRPVVPLSRNKGKNKNPGTISSVPGRLGTKSLTLINNKQEKDIIKQ